MRKKHIAVIGLGGVGGYFGFKINQANEINKQHQISFIVRGETYEKVKQDGLTLFSPEHPICVTKPDAVLRSIAELRSPDLVLICVKEYDLENVCNQLVGVITEDTIILPMMNGVDIYERIKRSISNNIILPSCVYVASHIKEKGIVEHKGKTGKLIFGKDPEYFTADINWVIDLMREAAIDFDFKENSLPDIWTKFIFIASFGLVTAKYNSSIGAVCLEEQQKKEAAQIMEEIKLSAERKGIYLGENIIPKTFEKASGFPPETPTSLQLDVNSGKKSNELELFAGAIIRYGPTLKVETPFTKKMYEQIQGTHK